MTHPIRVRREDDAFAVDWGRGPRRCAIGRGGVGMKAGEGDGVTPVGLWPLREVFYRADRIARPETSLPLQAIAQDDGWCDAPGDPNYNRRVKLPYNASAENLWRSDGLYDVVIVLGYNDAPVVPGRGSAIFLHVAAKDFSATEGCVALDRQDIVELLRDASPGSVIDIAP